MMKEILLQHVLLVKVICERAHSSRYDLYNRTKSLMENLNLFCLEFS